MDGSKNKHDEYVPLFAIKSIGKGELCDKIKEHFTLVDRDTVFSYSIVMVRHNSDYVGLYSIYNNSEQEPYFKGCKISVHDQKAMLRFIKEPQILLKCPARAVLQFEGRNLNETKLKEKLQEWQNSLI